jgi:hypothetical protein
MQDLFSQPDPGLVETDRHAAKGLAEEYESKIQVFTVQFIEGGKKILRIFIVFPPMIPDNNRQVAIFGGLGLVNERILHSGMEDSALSDDLPGCGLHTHFACLPEIVIAAIEKRLPVVVRVKGKTIRRQGRSIIDGGELPGIAICELAGVGELIFMKIGTETNSGFQPSNGVTSDRNAATSMKVEQSTVSKWRWLRGKFCRHLKAHGAESCMRIFQFRAGRLRTWMCAAL